MAGLGRVVPGQGMLYFEKLVYNTSHRPAVVCVTAFDDRPAEEQGQHTYIRREMSAYIQPPCRREWWLISCCKDC